MNEHKLAGAGVQDTDDVSKKDTFYCGTFLEDGAAQWGAKRIKTEIEEKGSYTARSGRVIVKLGVDDVMHKVGKNGNAVQAAKADEHAQELATMLTNLKTQILRYYVIANQLKTMGVPTTKNRRTQNSLPMTTASGTHRQYVRG